jgi:hypothetical protein
MKKNDSQKWEIDKRRENLFQLPISADMNSTFAEPAPSPSADLDLVGFDSILIAESPIRPAVWFDGEGLDGEGHAVSCKPSFW